MSSSSIAGAELTFGYTHDDVLGRNLADLIVPPHLRAAHDGGMRRYLRTGEPHVLGRRIEVEAVDQPWAAAAGRVGDRRSAARRSPPVHRLPARHHRAGARLRPSCTRQREALHQSEKMTALGSLLAGCRPRAQQPAVGRRRPGGDARGGRHGPGRPRLAGADCAAPPSAAPGSCAVSWRWRGSDRRELQPVRPARGTRRLARHARLRHAQQRGGDRAPRCARAAAGDGGRRPDPPGAAQPAAQRDPGGRGRADAATRAGHGSRPWRVWFGSRSRTTGLGVPAELRGRIFDPFFTTKPVGMGTGLGLSVCQGIVEAHGGTLTLEDRPQGGGCFVVTLPIAASTGEPLPPAAGPSSDGIGGRVLVIDDEPDIAAMLADALGRDGHEVVTAADGLAGSGAVADANFRRGLVRPADAQTGWSWVRTGVGQGWPRLCRTGVFDEWRHSAQRSSATGGVLISSHRKAAGSRRGQEVCTRRHQAHAY